METCVSIYYIQQPTRKAVLLGRHSRRVDSERYIGFATITSCGPNVTYAAGSSFLDNINWRRVGPYSVTVTAVAFASPATWRETYPSDAKRLRRSHYHCHLDGDRHRKGHYVCAGAGAGAGAVFSRFVGVFRSVSEFIRTDPSSRQTCRSSLCNNKSDFGLPATHRNSVGPALDRSILMMMMTMIAIVICLSSLGCGVVLVGLCVPGGNSNRRVW